MLALYILQLLDIRLSKLVNLLFDHLTISPSPFQMDINGIVLQNCTLRRIWSELKQSAEVEKRVAAVASFNKVSHCFGVCTSVCRFAL